MPTITTTEDAARERRIDEAVGRLMIGDYIKRICANALRDGPRALEGVPSWARRIIERAGVRGHAKEAAQKVLEAIDG